MAANQVQAIGRMTVRFFNRYSGMARLVGLVQRSKDCWMIKAITTRPSRLQTAIAGRDNHLHVGPDITDPSAKRQKAAAQRMLPSQSKSLECAIVDFFGDIRCDG